MRVSQVVKNGLFVFGHASGEVGVAEALVARRLRHVSKHAQLLINHLLAVPRHLPHFGEYVVLDVITLFRRQTAPSLLFLTQIRALGGCHVVPLVELLADLVLLIWREVLESRAVLQHAITLLRR